jgi:hypothetical protein
MNDAIAALAAKHETAIIGRAPVVARSASHAKIVPTANAANACHSRERRRRRKSARVVHRSVRVIHALRPRAGEVAH